jgi:integrase
VMILLSIKAGLRACEIAGLEWSMALDARGKVADILAIRDAIAKKRGGQHIPVHPDLRRALRSLLRISEPSGPVIRSARGGNLRPTSVVNWFAALFRELGFEGCSSHSGRRTFITAAARNIHRSGCSLRDVQLLAGHRSIETTERYIDGDTRGQRRLGRPAVKRPSLPPLRQDRKDSLCILTSAGLFAVISPTLSGRAGSFDLRLPTRKSSLGSTATRAHWGSLSLRP